MTSRCLCLIALALPLCGDVTHDLLGDAAASLSEDNAAAFLKYCDPKMPDYQLLQTSITDLLARATVLSSIEVLSDTGDDSKRKLELDWFVQLRLKTTSGTIQRRRQRIRCTIEKQPKKKNKWLIVALEPLDLFRPQ